MQLNQDSSSRTISQLRAQIANLQMEILEYKQGKRSIDAEGNAQISDTSLENAMLLADNKRLQQRLKAMSETINALTERNTQLLSEKTIAGWAELGDSTDQSITELVGNYINEIEKLKAKLIESEQMFQQLKKQMSSPQKSMKSQNSYVDGEFLQFFNCGERKSTVHCSRIRFSIIYGILYTNNFFFISQQFLYFH